MEESDVGEGVHWRANVGVCHDLNPKDVRCGPPMSVGMSTVSIYSLKKWTDLASLRYKREIRTSPLWFRMKRPPSMFPTIIKKLRNLLHFHCDFYYYDDIHIQFVNFKLRIEPCIRHIIMRYLRDVKLNMREFKYLRMYIRMRSQKIDNYLDSRGKLKEQNRMETKGFQGRLMKLRLPPNSHRFPTELTTSVLRMISRKQGITFYTTQ